MMLQPAGHTVRPSAALIATGLSILAHVPPELVRALSRTGRRSRTGPAAAANTLPALRKDLAAVRRRHWAIEDGRVLSSTESVAALVFDHNAVPIAAVGVTVGHRCAGADEAGCGQDFAELAGPVRHSARNVTASIGGREPASPGAE